jgi:DNA processing protein
MQQSELKYFLSLYKTPLIGPRLIRTVIAYSGSAEAVFREKKDSLQKIPGIGSKLAKQILSYKDFDRIDKELAFIEKHKIQVLTYLDENFPRRMKDLEDAPPLLFYKGTANMNVEKVVAVVGTRNATAYGRKVCERIIDELSEYKVTIVSGLAFGIDFCAHKAALKNNMPTIAVLGHSLDMVYPYEHRSLAVEMLGNGGLLTEYWSGTKPDKGNFPERNRIVAGITDAVLVIESGLKGGALITADIAISYNRDVFAVPGRTDDEMSSGCNKFIKINRAILAENAGDIAYQLGWNIKYKTKPKVKIDTSTLNEKEIILVDILKEADKTHVDKISAVLNMNHSELSLILLDMEFRGFINALPGNFYRTA